MHAINGVVENEKGEKLQHVSVLIAGSTRGAETDAYGKFTINNVTAGNYQVIISLIGYDRITRSITIKDQDNYQRYELNASPINLKDVVISFDADRDKHLALFKKYFIGETVNARQCDILNPNVLYTQFDKETQLLSVSADSLLIIDNYALGYRIKYLLTDFELDLKNSIFRFSGTPVFEELKGTDKRRKEWETRRQKAYDGSVMHFFRSAYNNSLNSNGFILYNTSKSGNTKNIQLNKVKPSRIFSVVDSQFISARIDSPLYVAYNKGNTPWDFTATGGRVKIPLEPAYKNAQVSKLTMFCDSLIIDKNGNYVSDKNHSILQSIDFQGYWAWKKIADLLPLDYEDKNPLTNSVTTAQTANDPVIEKVAKGVDHWLTVHQPEKIYLQTDKPYYAAGDNIWFKLYITVGNRHQLSALSALVNVELLDERDSVKQWIRLPVASGMARGDLALPDTLHQGKYRLRAYTNWMRNGGPDYYFDKQLTIGNEKAPVVAAIKKIKRPKAAISFFPEGGNLVNGLRSVVAFKAVADNGLGIAVQGTVTDGQDNIVCTFNTAHLGMGQFSFTPEKGKAYKALVSYPDGSKNSVTLPVALNSGYVLHLNSADTANLHLQVTASADLLGGQVYLYAQTGGETRYAVKNKPGIMPFNATIPKSGLPSGIVQFTLFSATGEPLNERIAFVNHEDELLRLRLDTSKIISAQQGKVQNMLEVRDAAGDPVTGSFSVAVIDESKVKSDDDNQSTIISQLLLTSDLRGYIEQPAYYLNKSDTATRNNLDILMLTQGYRRFEWKPLLEEKIPTAIYPAEQQAGIAGTVKTRSGKPLPDAKVTLITADGSFFSPELITDQQGRFQFTNIFKDSTKLVLQASHAKNGRDLDIVLDDIDNRDRQVATRYPAELEPAEKENLSTYFTASRQLYDEERKYGLNNHVTMLKTVNIRAVRNKPTITHSSNLNGPGNANLVITAEELEKRGSINLWHTIQNIVVKPLANDPNNPFGAPPKGVTFIVDGNRVSSNLIDGLPISIIASVEYLSSPAYTTIYGPGGQNPVFVITTKGIEDIKSDLNKIPAPGILTFTPKGYHVVREFYSPQYDDPKTNKTLANLRNTIYWQPDLVTDKTGHTSFAYYNAGSPGTYLVTIEGIGADGNLGRLVYRYQVK